MQKIRLLSKFLIISVLLFSCKPSTNNIVNQAIPVDTVAKSIFREELPPANEKVVNAGRLKMNANGQSIGKKTELTELLKLVKNSDVDVCIVNWVWVSSAGYDDMPMEIFYSKRDNELILTYLQNNVKEEFKNVSPECLKDFLNKGMKSFYSLESMCEGASYNFNNKEMKNRAIGAQPEQSEIDGSVKIVEDYLKQRATNVDFLEWSKVTPFGVYWIVRCTYKDNKSDDTKNVWFYIQNNKVVNVKPI